MNKYLIEILKIQDSIILPGLGALMVANQKTGKIVFNQHLKFNDGSLANFIAEKESIDVQEAQNRVAKFVREIEAVLGKGDSYDMFEFGRFYKNKDGAVDFEMAGAVSEDIKEKKTEQPKKETPKKDASTSSVKKEEPKKVKPVAEVVKSEPEGKKEVSSASSEGNSSESKGTDSSEKKETKQAKNKFIPKDEKSDADTKKKIEEKKDPVKKEVKADKKPVEAKKTEEPKPTNSPKQQKNKYVPTEDNSPKKEEAKKVAATIVSAESAPKINATKETATKTAEKSTTKETVIVKEEKKKKRGFIWIILIILILGLAAAGYFFKDKIMAWFDHNEGVEHIDEEHNENDGDHIATDNEDSMISDTTAYENTDSTDASVAAETEEVIEEEIIQEEEVEEIEEVEEEPVVNNVVNQGSNSGSYHLIGNAFGEKGNAERYVSEMSAKGYPAIILGRFDGLYLVSLKSYDSREAAQSGRSGVSSDASSAWVFKYPK